MIARALRVVRIVEEGVLAWGILSIAALTIANTVARAAFGFSLTFAEEVSQFLILYVTFLGLSHAAGSGRHIRMSALFDQLSPRPRKAAMIVIHCATSALLAVMGLYALRYAGSLRASGTVSPVLRVPLFFVVLCAPVGFFLAALQYALAAGRNFTDAGVWIAPEVEEGYEELPPT